MTDMGKARLIQGLAKDAIASQGTIKWSASFKDHDKENHADTKVALNYHNN